METKIFESKKDLWLMAILWGAVLVNIVACSLFVYYGCPPFVWTFPLLIIVGGLLPLWILFTTKYTFTGDKLLISCGPMRVSLNVKEIESITPTRNPLSSPALSLDRLLIKYSGGKSVMVSPMDKEGFVSEITSRKNS
jgi:hypothetical protein